MHTEENGHELDQRTIRFLKYVRTVINAYLKNQVENHSKMDNSVNNQKSKISNSNFSRARKEKRDNMLEIMSQKILFLLLNIIIKTVGTRVSNLSHFWSGDNLVQFSNIKKHFCLSKDDVRI